MAAQQDHTPWEEFVRDALPASPDNHVDYSQKFGHARSVELVEKWAARDSPTSRLSVVMMLEVAKATGFRMNARHFTQ